MKRFKNFLSEKNLGPIDMRSGKPYREHLLTLIKDKTPIKLEVGGEVVLKFASKKFEDIFKDTERIMAKDGKKYAITTMGNQFVGDDGKEYKISDIAKTGQFTKPPGVKDPSKPSGSDWENLITKAYNELYTDEITVLTDVQQVQWKIPEVKESAMKLAEKFKELGGDGTMEQFGAGEKGKKKKRGEAAERLSKFWKDMVKIVKATASSIPKTDMLIGDVKISLKKKGKSQTGSPSKGEAYATFRAAGELVGENSKSDFNDLLRMIKKQWKTIHSDIDARDIDKAVKRGTEKQLPNQKTVQDVIKQAALHKNMTGVFTEFFNNNDAFRHYFVYEAASGYKKFGNGKATANKMIEFDPTGHVLSENIDIGADGHPTQDIKNYSDRVQFNVGFKSSGGAIMSSLRLLMRSEEYKKPETTFQNIINESIQEMDFGSLNEQSFLDEASFFRAVIDKIKNVWNVIWDKTEKILDRIVNLGKRALEALMRFFGIELTNIQTSGPALIFDKMV